MKYLPHPLSLMVPEMSSEEYAELPGPKIAFGIRPLGPPHN
jgi:hypothetical protein